MESESEEGPESRKRVERYIYLMGSNQKGNEKD
jgi:hypothetical protein